MMNHKTGAQNGAQDEEKMRGFGELVRRRGLLQSGGWTGVLVVALLGLTATARVAAQVVPAGDEGGYRISAGGLVSGFHLQYGDRKLGGVTAFVDADTIRGLGFEAEARWLDFHQFANMHAETYSAGLRYHRNWRKLQPYAKGLVGFANLNFPYDYGTGRYTVVTMGGGVDYLWKHRVAIRAADFEYQYWPMFTYGSMSSYGISTGLRVRIF
jgi:hypothetical protein